MTAMHTVCTPALAQTQLDKLTAQAHMHTYKHRRKPALAPSEMLNAQCTNAGCMHDKLAWAHVASTQDYQSACAGLKA